MVEIITIAVLGSTRGTDLQYLLDAIHDGRLDAKISCVISNKADAYILERARKHGIPAVAVDSKGKTREEFDAELVKTLSKWNPELVLLIGYMRILSPAFIRAYRHRIMNVHPSLLPKYAGGMDTNVYEEMLKNKDAEGGITIHFVDEGVDTGPIVLQKSYPVEARDTVESLKEKGQRLEGEGFIEAITLFAQGRLHVEKGEVRIL